MGDCVLHWVFLYARAVVKSYKLTGNKNLIEHGGRNLFFVQFRHLTTRPVQNTIRMFPSTHMYSIRIKNQVQ